jgi:hypothetical protein
MMRIRLFIWQAVHDIAVTVLNWSYGHLERFPPGAHTYGHFGCGACARLTRPHN